MPNSLIQQFQQINGLLKKARTILIASHETPDSDAVGSTLALHHAFQKASFRTLCYLPDQSPKNLNFLPGFFEVKTVIPSAFLNPDIIFCLDYGDFERLKLPSSTSGKALVTIDHHRGDQKGDIKIIEPEFSSTSEIIYYFLKEIGIEINKEIATCLLTGIISDSGGFSHISTSSQTMKTASQLLLTGAPLTKIARRILSLRLQSTPQPDISKIWGLALSRIKFIPIPSKAKNSKETGLAHPNFSEKNLGGLAYSWLTFDDLRESRASLLDLAGISSVVSTTSSVNPTLFLVEYEKGKIKGSLRSEPFKGKSVVAIAEALGGGGHPYAAGFKQAGTITEVLKKVINLIE